MPRMTVLLSWPAVDQMLLAFAFVGLFAATIVVVTAFIARFAGSGISGVSASLMSPLGALFGLTAGFLAASVWQNHGDGVAAATREARAIAEVRLTSSYLAEPLRSDVQTGIRTYEKIVVEEEWPALPTIMTEDNPVSNRARDALLATARRVISSDAPPSLALTGTVQAVRLVAEARASRMDVALRRISGVQLVSTLILGLLLITLVAVVHHTSRLSQIIGVFLASCAVANTIGAIVAHDNPFEGYLAVTSADFASLAAHIGGDLGH
jgi:hypothetical protein